MAPKKEKGRKLALTDFLADDSFGKSWADEMDSLPTAPAIHTSDDIRSSSFAAHSHMPPREDIPLPTQPPYTAFVGNLPFDLTDSDLEAFFSSLDSIKNVKIIRDRDDKPKGFGYVEFSTVEALKGALDFSGRTLANRTVRVNVAEPQKERPGTFSAPRDDKFTDNWRRDGPLPDLGPPLSGSAGPTRRRYAGIGVGGETAASDHSSSPPDMSGDWRSNRRQLPPAPDLPPPALGGPRRRGSGFSTPTHDGDPSPADKDQQWLGAKFRPSSPVGGGGESLPGSKGGRYGSLRGAPPSLAASSGPVDEGNWRNAIRSSTSPSNSVPPTPQMPRRKLELLPRSGAGPGSGASQPSSPKSAASSSFNTTTTTTGTTSTKPNPFGEAKPVDVTKHEEKFQALIDEERNKQSRGRIASGPGRDREYGHGPARGQPRSGHPYDGGSAAGVSNITMADDDEYRHSRTHQHTTPDSMTTSPTTATETGAPTPEKAPKPSANVRAALSFAAAAGGKGTKESVPTSGEAEPESRAGEEEGDASIGSGGGVDTNIDTDRDKDEDGDEYDAVEGETEKLDEATV